MNVYQFIASLVIIKRIESPIRYGMIECKQRINGNCQSVRNETVDEHPLLFAESLDARILIDFDEVDVEIRIDHIVETKQLESEIRRVSSDCRGSSSEDERCLFLNRQRRESLL